MPRPPKKTPEGTPPRASKRRKTEPEAMPDAAGMGVAPSAAAEPSRPTAAAGGADTARETRTTPAVSERKPPTAASHTTADSAPQKSPVTLSSQISDDEIRQRAYELYEQRGGAGGDPEEDWYRAEQELRARKGSKSACPMPKVLLVDDDATQVQIRQAVLRRAGFEVESVQTAADALERVRAHTASSELGLVVTDHLLPRSTGAELVRQIRSIAPQVPVIVLTGLGEAEAEYAALDVTFRQKPLSPEELIALVNNALQVKGPGAA